MSVSWSARIQLEDKISERLVSKHSQKVGFKANIRPQKKLSDERIFVRLGSSYTGHDVNTLDA